MQSITHISTIVIQIFYGVKRCVVNNKKKEEQNNKKDGTEKKTTTTNKKKEQKKYVENERLSKIHSNNSNNTEAT